MDTFDVRVQLAISDDREHMREIRSTVDGGNLADEPVESGNEPRLSHMSMNERAFPIIGVESVGATRVFYEALRFSQTYRFPSDREPEHLSMSRGGRASASVR